jgi:DNA topoisomerase VI subunit B
MSIADTLLREIDQEMATTRKVIERVPTDKGEWKPHPKSMSLGHLTQLVAGMPGGSPTS